MKYTKEEFLAKIQEAYAKIGLTPITWTFYDDDPPFKVTKCCPLTAIHCANADKACWFQAATILNDCCHLLDVSLNWLRGFYRTVDTGKFWNSEFDSEAIEYGLYVRKKLFQNT